MAGFSATGNAVLVGIIAVLTAAFVLSAVSGVAKGIQWLSNINMVLAIALALFVFIVGPTVFILNLVPTSIGSYVADLPMMAARTAAEGSETSEWLSAWTVFYWAWWLSWTPVRRHVHRPHLARSHHPAVRHRRPAGAQPGQRRLVLHLRRRGDRPAEERHRHRRCGGLETSSSPPSRPTRSPRSPASW